MPRKINVLGKEVTLEDNEYLLTKDTGKLVIRNSALVRLAKENGLGNATFEYVENARAFTTDKFSYVAIARIKRGDDIYEEVGEANHLNCIGEIDSKCPATMAKTRAVNRVIIAALDLNGIVYSECEFTKGDLVKEKVTTPNTGNGTNNQNNKQKPDRAKAGEVLITVGFMKGKPIKECKKENIDWLMKNVKPSNEENKKMLEALKVYFCLK